MASITLPRPSRKGNLANVVISNLYNIRPSVAGIGGERQKKKKQSVSTKERTPARTQRD